MIGLNHTRIQIQLCNSQTETSALWQASYETGVQTESI